MTIDTSGFTTAQSRIAQIQSLFTTATPTSAVVKSATPATGAFGEAMSRAQGPGTQARSSDGGSTAAANTPVARAAAAASSVPTTTLAARSAPAATTTSTTAPDSTTGSLGLKDANAVLATAKKYLGIPYKWGGTNPRIGLDCSGFVQLVMKQHGISLPRVSRDQARQGAKVASLSQARPGDLVAFGSPVHHIGIYVGDGKMIHAPRTGDVVKISKVHKNLTAIRRVLPDQPAAATLTQPAASPKNAAGLPAAGIDTVKLASTLRTTALSAGVDASTYQQAVASAVKDSLTGSDVESAQAVLQTALAGLGTTTPNATSLVDAAVRPGAAVAAGARPRLAPDAVGTSALNQAPAALQRLFRSAEGKYGVPATLLAAVAKQESNFKTRAVSRAGAQGLMQLMPGTARGLGVKNSFDPAQAVDGAARLLRSHLRAFGSTELALAAYNAGAGAVRKYNGIPPYRETQNYVRRIMAGLEVAA
ncbi:transglycosylase SLT domain-containing protein [Mobilicoccus massiliensis]|uniref:transglycosylase SLT domain-containing protein n=1 Tax=Mobilicoccus massiliensis TaxID=1522310 RepID=UPI0006942BBE|nr:transglycosylase SLT domain-containing protein [Mobilicoccus massiliensis]